MEDFIRVETETVFEKGKKKRDRQRWSGSTRTVSGGSPAYGSTCYCAEFASEPLLSKSTVAYRI